MANNRKIRVDIEGDSSGLQKALNTGSEAIEGFGKKAGGTIGEFADVLGGGLGNAATALTGFGAALGVAAAGITVTFAAVQHSSEKAFEKMEAASLSQMGLTQIQQMANMYASVGLTMENIADQQKDVKDKIGDAITNIGGSVYTDIIQPLKLNAGALQQMADTGGDVIAKIYFQAKQMGYSQSQIINMMETIGNDATKRLTVLKEFNAEQEYQNSLANQTITLTDQQATQFGTYQQATRDLSNAWEKWENDTLAPVAERLAQILNLITQILNSKPVAAAAAATSQEGIDGVKNYNQGFMQQNLANSSIYGQKLVGEQLDQQKKNDDALKGRLEQAQQLQQDLQKLTDQSKNGFSSKQLDSQSQSFQSDSAKFKRQIDVLDTAFTSWRTNVTNSLYTAYKGDVDAMNKAIEQGTADYKKQRENLYKQMTKDEDAEAAKKKSAAEKAAREQAALDKKNADARVKAEQVIAKAIADTQTDAHAHQLAEFDRQQAALVEQIKKAAATLGISPEELLGKQKLASAANRDTLIKNQLGITQNDPNATINNQNRDIANLQKTGDLSEDNRNFLVKQQASNIGNIDGSIDTKQALSDNDAAMNAQLQQNDLLLKGHEGYEQQKAAITAKYNAKAVEIGQKNAQLLVGNLVTSTGQMADAASDAFGKSSGVAKAAAIANKAMIIAQTVMNIQLALSQAMAAGFPASIPLYIQAGAMGMSILATAKSAAGQFHGGIDDLPSTMDNKSFVLKAGERVVQPEANTKLTKFLDKQNSNGGSMGDTTVNAPLIINGSTDDDAKFDEMLKKHANNVSLAVRNAQKRNS